MDTVKYLLFSLLVFVLCSCSAYHSDYAACGADEFVCDSYRIREGKSSMLEMLGRCPGKLSVHDLMEYRDVIVEDDILNIAVYHPSRKDLASSIRDLNENIGGFPVYRGQVALPDLPPIEVAGLTLEEAKELLQGHFRQHVQDVELYVTYRDRLRRKVELIGMVGNPAIPVDGKMRLYEVLAKANIPSHANLFMSYVMRNGNPLPVDLYKLINEGDMSQNIVMRGGDKIFIAQPCDSSVVVMGEVRAPRAVDLPYGFISLRSALVAAGGIPYTGDLDSIQVIRGNLQSPKIYSLTWDHIVHLPNDSLLLMPGDTVYVSATPITEWNRFMEQLIPISRSIKDSYDIYRITCP